MKAAVVRKFGEPLVIEDRPVPEPGPGQITVRMEASGLCHTDIHAAHGDWPVKPTPPFVPGHEGVGTVAAIGPAYSVVPAGLSAGCAVSRC
jgi:propanol-preferring alcohol dehydrogenase